MLTPTANSEELHLQGDAQLSMEVKKMTEETHTEDEKQVVEATLSANPYP